MSGVNGWLTSLSEYIGGMSDELDNAKAENIKLRELVRDMFRDFARADYELKSRCGRTFMAVTRYEPRLRELGVDE